VQSFTTDFTFQQAPGTTPTADGMAFVLQNSGIAGLGVGGGGLGYGSDTPGAGGGIPNSIAIKFDLYSNAGEGPNSTGLYSNGASPTTPAMDMTSSGINLHSADVMHAHITYDGTTLSLTLSDTVTGATFSTSWPINISTTIGSNTAYAGFTGGTGGSSAVQDVVTWTYSANNVKAPVTYWTPNLTAVSSGPTFRTFAWSGFPEGSGTTLDATAVGDSVTFTVNVAQAGVYNLSYNTKAYNTRGTNQLSINGTNVGAVIDQYNAGQTLTSFNLGTFNFATTGNYSFKFTVTGKNAASSGYTMAFDDIILTPQ
jgi:Legume lectin domain